MMSDERRCCVMCGPPAVSEHLFRKGAYAILRCRLCGLIFASPHPTHDELEQIYSESFFQVGEKFAGQVGSSGRLNAEHRVRRLLTTPGVTRGRWLDVGCATGDFMLAARPHVGHIAGVEMSKYAAEQTRAKGLQDVVVGDFLRASLGNDPVDVVTMWDVIEHVPDPLAFLRHAFQLLRNGGLIALSTGDIGSLVARVMGRFWHLMIPPRHLYFFSPVTIRNLLSQAGFEAVVVSKPGKRVPLDFALWKLASLVTPRAGSAALRLGALTHLGRLAPFVNLWDIMTIVARKRPLGMTPSPEDVSTHQYDSLVNRS
ncbi:MAG: class I SAM-dependent methyltransferase [Acidobacteriota bacterium]|nr:class I SAM-dependent methyltransferase [Acidobacteriota bacterium]